MMDHVVSKTVENTLRKSIDKSSDYDLAERMEEMKKVIIEEVRRNLVYSKPEGPIMSSKDILTLSQEQESKFNEEVHELGLHVNRIHHNSTPAFLYEMALKYESNSFITSTGALCCISGEKTGRSPSDKRIVKESSSEEHIWWGKVNIPLKEKSYEINKGRAIDYLNLQPNLYVIDAYAGWDEKCRIKIRVITSRAYHALYMLNMLIPPKNVEEIQNFIPDFIIYNAGDFPSNRLTDGMSSQTSVIINFGAMNMIILGTQYAGEMKKGILTLFMYKMPLEGKLPLHSSCNIGKKNDVTLFFGLSGTGKTTLSADANRYLIGDDEHVWTDDGIFNIEGGCYAKCKGLSKKQEPEIYKAIKFGAILENVVMDPVTREVDYNNCSITENTRCAYPLSYIENAKIPAYVNTHPQNIILLTCDAFGVIPPLSKLNVYQMMYHFVSGYTSKMAGTESDVLKPTATFSSCYAAPFLAHHPMVYAQMLAEKYQKHKANVWLLNTGWIYGSYGSKNGQRIPLKYTRMLVDCIHENKLIDIEYKQTPIFNFSIPARVDGIPEGVLDPVLGWKDKEDYMKNLQNLAKEFISNFTLFSDKAGADILSGGPTL
ncbi:phosphoenolpyruvate carboxykinase (ATP) [Plasmodium fragile]|uniref:phosphoenolpyruvate carboxykinase (ATP) n=1 Tax=Plasmodium fragile TaxID=5857 RepID=A0A0D9QDX5_PLAFR|nr:phosphoenolpyruvate carboxykinase (ATP) [Plasmodium fragile]KJP85255.1 phosphoenolpyruvate carboxykinase (ATP) [Plasmodium fragile]